MYLQVSPAGSKRWFLKYRVAGAEKQLALGGYPAVTLTAARRAREAAKLQKSQGRDPVQVHNVTKLKTTTATGDTFKETALEWYEKHHGRWSSHYAIREKRNLEKDLFPFFATRHIGGIEPTELLAAIRRVEERGALDVAHRVLTTARAVWRYAVATARIARHHCRLGRRIDTAPQTALRSDHRPREAPHLVPLPKQAVEILRKLHPLTGGNALVFPGERSHDRSISDNTLRAALLTLGYGPTVQTVHGFRATGRTMLAERLDADPLVIEAQLAHAVKDANGRAYNRTQYFKHRAAMVQMWADYLDKLAAGAVVIPLRAA